MDTTGIEPANLLRAKQTLSRLSYMPVMSSPGVAPDRGVFQAPMPLVHQLDKLYLSTDYEN